MKRLIVIAAILITAVTFEGCYSARPYYPGPVVYGPGYYRPAPVVISTYGRGYYGGRHGGWGHRSRY